MPGVPLRRVRAREFVMRRVSLRTQSRPMRTASQPPSAGNTTRQARTLLPAQLSRFPMSYPGTPHHRPDCLRAARLNWHCVLVGWRSMPREVSLDREVPTREVAGPGIEYGRGVEDGRQCRSARQLDREEVTLRPGEVPVVVLHDDLEAAQR